MPRVHEHDALTCPDCADLAEDLRLTYARRLRDLGTTAPELRAGLQLAANLLRDGLL